MHKKFKNIAALGLAVGAIGSLVPSLAHAATWTWIGSGGSAATPTSGNWNVNANWLGANFTTTASGTGNVLLFGGSGGTAYTATDNQGAMSIGTISLNSSASVTETIANSSSSINNTSGSGAPVTIEQRNSGAFSIAVPIAIKNSPLNLTSTTATPGLVTMSGAISGSAGGTSINMTGGNYLLTNTSNSVNGTTVGGGILRITSASVLSSNSATISSGAVLGLDTNFNPNSIIATSSTGIVALNVNNTALTGLNGSSAFLGSLGDLTFTPAGAYAAGAGNTYRFGGGGGTLTVSGTNKITGANAVIIGSTQTNGSGTVVFASAQNYSLSTTINAGTLALSGSSTNLITSTPTITLANGAKLNVLGQTGGAISLAANQTLAGTGTVYGGVNASNSNTTLGPGSGNGGAGQLTFSSAGDISLSTNATYVADIGASTTPGTTYDQIVLSDAAVKTLNINGAKLKLLPMSGIVTNTAYTIVTTSGAGAVDFTGLFKNLDGTNLMEGPTYTQGQVAFSIDYDSTFVKVTFTTIPEPSTLSLALLSVPALLRRRRRQA